MNLPESERLWLSEGRGAGPQPPGSPDRGRAVSLNATNMTGQGLGKNEKSDKAINNLFLKKRLF